MAGLQRKLLVCGKAGVGKSTLINSLFGRNVCKVNEPSLPSGHLGLGTTKVERAPPIRFGSSVLEIFDSPGLEIDEYLEDIHKNCKHVDLFLYCVEMNAARFTRDDKKSLELFTKRFGADFWKRCVLVLTKPNTVMVPAGKRHRYDAILEKFRAELELNGVSGTITSKIPVYAAGLSYYRSEVPLEALHDFRYIWYVSDGAKQPAEGRTIEFLTELWAMCLKSIEIIKAKEKYEQELKLTSAQQEEKMEELIAMHGQQEKRELEMKRKHNSAIVEPQFSGLPSRQHVQPNIGSSQVTDEPTLGPAHLDQLAKAVRYAKDSWRAVGEALGFTVQDLNDIERAKGKGEDYYCFQELLLRWLKRAPPLHPFPHVKQLADALRAAGEHRTAYELEHSREFRGL